MLPTTLNVTAGNLLVRVCSVVVILTAAANYAAGIEHTVVFRAGDDGYDTYRIPTIVQATNGDLLAIVEGRVNDATDDGDIDLVMKRSTDNGVTWGPLQVVQHRDNYGGWDGLPTSDVTVGNPGPVVDRTEGPTYGRISLLFTLENDRVFATYSDDHGATWLTDANGRAPEITSTVKETHWGWYAIGPVHGIQIERGDHAGRLVVTADHVATGDLWGAHAVYSDDHGATWQLGAQYTQTSGAIRPNENAVVELTNGDLYFNARDHGSASGVRSETTSSDGGGTFAGPFTNSPLGGTTVQGSAVRFAATDKGDGENLILLSLPDSTSREDMTIFASDDETATWSAGTLITGDRSAYSDLIRTGDGKVGLLWETSYRGESSNAYKTITFARLDRDELEAAPGSTIAMWNLSERAAGQAVDANPGAVHNDVAYDLRPTAQGSLTYVDGAPKYDSGAAIHFDGNSKLVLTDAASYDQLDFDENDSFTIETVFRTDQNGTMALVAKDVGANQPSWWLRLEDGEPVFLIEGDVTNDFTKLRGDEILNDGTWRHLAAVRDTAEDEVRLYLNGSLIASAEDVTNGSLANSNAVAIGAFGTTSSRNFTGDIDLVRISRGALSPDEFIQEIPEPSGFLLLIVGLLGLAGCTRRRQT